MGRYKYFLADYSVGVYQLFKVLCHLIVLLRGQLQIIILYIP